MFLCIEILSEFIVAHVDVGPDNSVIKLDAIEVVLFDGVLYDSEQE